jgi:murein DD-endopeptidase MepM/ murein hydrolase activator NlpD
MQQTLTTKIRNRSLDVKNILASYPNFGPIIPDSIIKTKPYIFDLTKNNLELGRLDLNNEKAFSDYITQKIDQNKSQYGVGRYNENRVIYRRSKLFETEIDPRSIHLGIDLWLPAQTPVFAPLDGKVHSFQDNAHFGDYGPTIILEHNIENVKFYTLYGHLSRKSLEKLKVGMKIQKGQEIAKVGGYEENGQWPTHVHFEIITDILGKIGDFPGVSSLSDREFYLTICPNPNLILKIKSLS